jgi:hypothetical protein
MRVGPGRAGRSWRAALAPTSSGKVGMCVRSESLHSNPKALPRFASSLLLAHVRDVRDHYPLARVRASLLS